MAQALEPRLVQSASPDLPAHTTLGLGQRWLELAQPAQLESMARALKPQIAQSASPVLPGHTILGLGPH
jgi:hypothetical protein